MQRCQHLKKPRSVRVSDPTDSAASQLPFIFGTKALLSEADLTRRIADTLKSSVAEAQQVIVNLVQSGEIMKAGEGFTRPAKEATE